MAVSEAHKRASYKYNSSKDNIMIRPDKDTGRSIRDAAADADQSVQAYILQAIRERMERDNTLLREAMEQYTERSETQWE